MRTRVRAVNSMSDRPRSSRKPLHERTNSESNTQAQPPQSPTTIRIIPKTPPRLLGSGAPRDDVHSRNPLPTLPSHFLAPANANGRAALSSAPSLSPVSDEGFQRTKAQFSPTSMKSIGSGHSTLHPASELGGTSASGSSVTGSPGFKSKPPKKKILHIHKDNKTFSLKKDAPATLVSPSALSDEGHHSLRSPSSLSSLLYAQHKSSDSLYSQSSNAKHDSIGSCISSFPTSPTPVPATPAGIKNKEEPISADPIDPSPRNYELVGGLRQVPKTPDQKKAAFIEESPLPPLPEIPDDPPQVSVLHDLVAQPSFASTVTAGTTSTTSENANYKVYGDTSAATSDAVLVTSGDSNYEILEKSPSGSSNYETHQKSSSDGSNYQVYQKSSSEGINYEIHHKSSSEGNNYEIHHKSSDDSFYDTHEKPAASGSNYVVHHKSSDSSNYKTLEKSSSGGNSNYEVFGSPSPSGSVIYRPAPPGSEADTYEDYDEYDNESALSSPEFAQPNYSQPTTKFSHESLVIPPLQPRSSRPNQGFGYYKSRSRETLRTGSLTSITTVLSQKEAYKAIVASGSLVHLPIVVKKGKKLQKQRAEPSSSSWVPAPILAPPRAPPMQEHPHVWSSQLSTVLSESDGGTDRGSGVSAWSENNGGRRSSGFPSTQSRHSRQMLSISSSLAAEEAALARTRSESMTGSLEPPSAAFARTGRHHSQSSIRYVGDQDEYGDGITDMQDLRNRPSRTRLNSFTQYSASNSDPTTRTSTMRSTRSTRSTGSSRSRANSILVAAIPTWARVYYGSGERRGLIAPGSSILEADSRSNSFRSRSGSPNTDQFPLNIYSPRRRPRELAVPNNEERDSLEITPVRDTDVQGRQMQDRYSRRLRTWSMSSMWSPHLKHDRRAINRSAWVPPSVTWSSEGGAFGRRNIQVVMFIVGFIFPFGKFPLFLKFCVMWAN